MPEGEDYQKGEMLGHYNVRQYILYRDGYTCRCCGKHGEGVRFHIHHLETRKTGGDAPDNQVALCEDCHKKFHKGLLTADSLRKRACRSTRDAAFMGIMRKTLMERLRTELEIPDLIRPVRHHNRQLHKATVLKGGVRKANQAPCYVQGFRIYDKVLWNGEECYIWGRRTQGYFLLRKLDGTKVKDGVGYKKLKLLERSRSYLIA